MKTVRNHLWHKSISDLLYTGKRCGQLQSLSGKKKKRKKKKEKKNNNVDLKKKKKNVIIR